MTDDGDTSDPRALLSPEADPGPAAPTAPAVTAADLARLEARLAETCAERDRLHAMVVELQERLLHHYTDADRIHRETIRLDEHFANPAFYFLERLGPDRSFRWMGREEAAWLATRIPRTRALRVDILVETMISEAALEGLRVHADGIYAVASETQYLDSGAILRSFFIPAPPEPDPYGRVGLGIVAGERVDLTGRGDPRTLAVGIACIEITQITGDALSLAAQWHRTLPAPLFQHPAFHPPERRPGEDLAYRWFGAERDAEFRIAPPPGRAIRVEVEIVQAISEEALADFRIGLEDRVASDYEIAVAPDGVITKAAELRVPGAPGEPVADLRLRLSAGARRDMTSDGDPRHLAVAIRRLVMREVADEAFRGNGPFRAEIPFGRDFDHPAFYDFELMENGLTLRWMGRADEATLPVTVPAGVPLVVEAEIVHVISDQTLAGFTMTLDGLAPGERETSRDATGVLVVRAGFAPLEATGGTRERTVPLELRVAHKEDLTERGDPRTLAVALRKIVVRAA